MQTIKEYGTEKLARLRKVMLHKPVQSLTEVNAVNYQYHLFNEVPNIEGFLDEHDQYAQLLQSQGVEVFELGDYVVENQKRMNLLPNLTYLHDTAVVTSKGVILSKMCLGSRAGEEIVVKEALTNLGIPVFHEFGEVDEYEGCLTLSPKTLLIADTERHKPESIKGFLDRALQLFQEIILIEIPQARRFMHPDMIFNRISDNLALAFPQAFLHAFHITADKKREIDIIEFMKNRNIEIISVSDQEQQNWACTFVPLEPNVIINYDISLSLKTQNVLSSKGVEMIQFHPEAMLAGGGSLRCLTMKLLRQ